MEFDAAGAPTMAKPEAIADATTSATPAAKRKGSITEDDVSMLFNRYQPKTILILLQEVSRIAGAKVDWNALVKRTTSGLTSPRECQMLWRHLAYRDLLLDKVEEGAEPLDDDSDLEFELEALPIPNTESLSEAKSYVQILMSSGLTNRTLKVPSIIKAADDYTSMEQQFHEANVTRTAWTVKRSNAEVLDRNTAGDASLNVPKKRQSWTKEDDLELIRAVEKFGEEDFKNNRTASHLSQKRISTRKQDSKLTSGSTYKQACSTRSEKKLAAQKSIPMALDHVPKTGRFKSIVSGKEQSTAPPNSSVPSDGGQQKLGSSISDDCNPPVSFTTAAMTQATMVDSCPETAPHDALEAADKHVETVKPEVHEDQKTTM